MRKSPIRVWGEVISLACCQVDLPKTLVQTKQGGGRTCLPFLRACWHVQIPAWPGKGTVLVGRSLRDVPPLQDPFTAYLAPSVLY